MPLGVVVFVEVGKLVSSCAEIDNLPRATLARDNLRSPAAAADQMVRPECVVEVIEGVLTAVSECFKLMEDIASVHGVLPSQCANRN